MGDLEIEVVVQKATFLEAVPHFVAIQLNQDPKVRTELTSATKTPRFFGSRFPFILEGALDQDRVVEDVLYFALFEVTLKKGEEEDDTARYTGGGCLSLCEIRDQVVAEGSAEVTVALSRLPGAEGGEGVDVGELYLEVVGRASGVGVVGDGPLEEGEADASVRVQVLQAHDLPPTGGGEGGTIYVEVWLSGEQASSPVNEDGSYTDADNIFTPPSTSNMLIGRTREALNPSWDETLETALPPAASWRGDYTALTLTFRILYQGATMDQPALISQRVLPVAPMRSSPGPHLLGLECEPAGLLLTTVDFFGGSQLPGPGAMTLSGHEMEWPQGEALPSAPVFACLQLMPAEDAEVLATSLASELSFSLPFCCWPLEQQEPPPPCGVSTALLTDGQMSSDKLCWRDQARMLVPDEGGGDAWACVLRCLYATNNFKKQDREPPSEGYTCGLLFELFAYAIIPLPDLNKAASQPTAAETVSVLRLPAAAAAAADVQTGDGPLQAGGQLLSVTYRAMCSAVINRAWKKRKRPVAPPPPSAGADAEMVSQSTWENVDISRMGPEEIEKERPLTAHLEISPLERRLLALTDELGVKDSVIERLQHELDQQAEAIRRCGSEILKMRHEKHEVEAVRDAMKKRIQDSERESERAASLVVCEDGAKINQSSLPELQRVLPILIKRYHGVRVERDKLAQRVHNMAQDLQDLTVLKAAFAKLQRAHLGQSAYIQTLQGKQTRVESYKTTIRMQEKVIQRLEELLESKLQRNRSQDGTPRSTEDPTPRGIARGAALDALKEEVSRLRSENEALKQGAMEGHEVIAAAKDARIKAVEEELIEQAKASAKEIAELRMRLFELEYGLDGLGRTEEVLPL